MVADRPHEFDLIARYFAPLATDPGCLALTDDAAALTPSPGTDLVLTKDMLAAGVHFFPGDPPDSIAAKALRVNLSDLAAKGARPRAYLLGLALQDDWTEDWLAAFSAGLAADQARFGLSLYGGDTIRSGAGLVVSVTAIGEVPAGRTVRRNGARPGDRIFVTGTIGDAALGLRLRLDPGLADRLGLAAQEREHLLRRYLWPEPRTALAAAILDHASASIDVSDGLAADAGHVCRESRVDGVIDVDLVPFSPAARGVRAQDPGLGLACLTGGDDYEILACVPPQACDGFVAAAADAGVAVSCIGEVAEGGGRLTFTQGGRPVQVSDGGGFRHF
ncbi:thiamine-phosphate kinase [Polymorphum gilvum]|uniref:Thiamine-monophosphate kinase n=1 Tax=Polymorphum gilvum (strain LMG 25793 / CGMCC 1.9160 / SL003B-26A1) TaxID=991905 RepID=F2IWM3_POLGS|nr:thiamine-phosphate kinase [Polymorphum gilvum]ADZ70348.1 Thiamine-monophosphate kinase [Polymorphum gilvum SL003B-26A1]